MIREADATVALVALNLAINQGLASGSQAGTAITPREAAIAAYFRLKPIAGFHDEAAVVH
jgi:hypothetical protein